MEIVAEEDLEEEEEYDDEEFDENCRDGLCGHMQTFKDLSEIVFDRSYFKNIKKADKQSNKSIKELLKCKDKILDLKNYTSCSVCHAKIDTVARALDLSVEIIEDIRDNLPEREAMKIVMKAANLR